MTDTSRDVVAFSPSDADHATKGHIWSIYNPTLPNPYAVRDAGSKLQNAIDRIDPGEYDRAEGEWWTRLYYESVMDGDAEPVPRGEE